MVKDGEYVEEKKWPTSRFGGKKFKIEIDSSIWREEIQNRNRLLDLAGRKNLNRNRLFDLAGRAAQCHEERRSSRARTMQPPIADGLTYVLGLTQPPTTLMAL